MRAHPKNKTILERRKINKKNLLLQAQNYKNTALTKQFSIKLYVSR